MIKAIRSMCAGTALMMAAASSQAVPLIFFGEDIGINNAAAAVNSMAAEAAFLSNLSGVGTETFESFGVGTPGNGLVLNFAGVGTATLAANNSPFIANSPGAGRFAISGSQFLQEVDSTGFSLTFSSAVAAFGFYGTDIGDFNGVMQLELENGGTTTVSIGNSTNTPNGGALYYGYIDTANPFTKVTFNNTGGSGDIWGFDDLTIGSVAQVVPVPGTLALFGAAVLGLFGMRKRTA